MNVRHPMCVLNSFSIKNNIFYDKMDERIFYFLVTIFSLNGLSERKSHFI